MSFITLEGDNSPMRDITCFKCQRGYSVRWCTEYGDPLVGEHDVKCPNCGNDIRFGVYHEYTQSGGPVIREQTEQVKQAHEGNLKYRHIVKYFEEHEEELTSFVIWLRDNPYPPNCIGG